MKAICDSKPNWSERQICLIKLVLTGKRQHEKPQSTINNTPEGCSIHMSKHHISYLWWIRPGEMPEVHLIVNKKTNVRRQKIKTLGKKTATYTVYITTTKSTHLSTTTNSTVINLIGINLRSAVQSSSPPVNINNNEDGARLFPLKRYIFC